MPTLPTSAFNTPHPTVAEFSLTVLYLGNRLF